MKMKQIHGKGEVNVVEWATVFGLFEFYFIDVECEEGYRLSVVYGPEGDVEIGAVEMEQLKKFPGYFPPSPITRTTMPPPGWKWAS